MLIDQQNQYFENDSIVDSNLYVQWNPYQNDSTVDSNLYVQWNPYQNSNGILHRDRKINPKVCMETQKTLNSQSNPEQKDQYWRHHNT
jgi:hypothetical protein